MLHDPLEREILLFASSCRDLPDWAKNMLTAGHTPGVLEAAADACTLRGGPERSLPYNLVYSIAERRGVTSEMMWVAGERGRVWVDKATGKRVQLTIY